MSVRNNSRWDVAVASIAALVYAPTLGGGTVWDDEFLTTRNPYLTPSRWGELVSNDLWVASAKGEAAGYYRPLGTLSLAVNRFLGNEPWSYHLGNVLVHAAVCVALRRLVLAYRPRATGTATLAALAFGLAPIATEAVEWLSGRFDLLGALFLLLAMRANVLKRTAAVVALFAAALFSKETLVIAPALFALDDLLHRRSTLRGAVPKYLALAGVGALYVWARTASHVPNAVMSERLVSAEAFRSYTGCVALYGATLARLVAPSIFHVYRDPGAAFAVACSAVLLAATLGLAAWARRERSRLGVMVGWLGALACLVPVGLTAPRLFQTGDRYAYVAVALVALAIGVGLERALRRAPIAARAATFGLAVFTAGGVPAVLRRHADWRDEDTLFRVELDRDPERYWAAALLGEIEAKRGNLPEAERLLLSARGHLPRPYRVETALCYVYLNEGRFTEARDRCDAALALQPDDPRALTNRANARLLLRDAEGALADAQHASRVKPQSAEAHAIAAEALYALGRRDEARAENDAALALAPSHARALRLRSILDR